MRRHRGWIGLAALALLGGCAQAVPPPVAAAPAVRGHATVVPTRGVDCTTHDFYLFTTASCGDGGFRILSAATE